MAVERLSRDVDNLLKKVSSPQKEIIQALRNLILETGPDLKEQVKWRNPTYTRKGNVCWIIAYEDHTDLGFFRGTELKDPKKILEGTGKGLRHLKIYKKDEINPAILRLLIKEAIVLDDG